jgi:hypothetical protein
MLRLIEISLALLVTIAEAGVAAARDMTAADAIRASALELILRGVI